MVVVHGTKKLLDRIGRPTVGSDQTPTSPLGSWYATALFWRPQAALFVNEHTLLPLLVPLAPATTLLRRLPGALERILTAHRIDRAFIDAELGAMTDIQLAKTANRSVVGVMNDFSRLLDHHRNDTDDLEALSIRLAGTPCGPLYPTHSFPDRALAALAEGLSQRRAAPGDCPP